MEGLKPGSVSEITREVTSKESAKELGSGTLEVFGTPSMVLMVEQLCLEMVESSLENGQTTVGVEINIKHLAPTPVGDVVRIRAEITSVTKNVIDFKALIWDSFELIGEADHRRVIIDEDRFLKRVHKKPPFTPK